MAEVEQRNADLVLDAGGVKGVALAGAVATLAAAGYRFPRIAGTSAGAIVGAVAAAMQRHGAPLSGLPAMAMDLDYSRFVDRGPVGRLLGPLHSLADAGSLLFERGIFEGDALHGYVQETLAEYGVRTWADLRLPDDPGSSLPEEHRYALVVTVSDVSRRRLALLPWDYHRYGLDADTQSVADAVRMSAGIPFFFEPMTLRSATGEKVTMVDGGMLSEYPITVFDRTDGRPPRWPTFGVKLSARPAEPPVTHETGSLASFSVGLVDTMLSAHDAVHVDDPCVQRRSVFVDTSEVSAVDFDIDDATKRRLLHDAEQATERFLATWDFADYLDHCRGAAS